MEELTSRRDYGITGLVMGILLMVAALQAGIVVNLGLAWLIGFLIQAILNGGPQ